MKKLTLTLLEKQVIYLASYGQTNEAIAPRLKITYFQVIKIWERIYAKLQLHNKTGACFKSYRLHLMDGFKFEVN